MSGLKLIFLLFLGLFGLFLVNSCNGLVLIWLWIYKNNWIKGNVSIIWWKIIVVIDGIE